MSKQSFIERMKTLCPALNDADQTVVQALGNAALGYADAYTGRQLQLDEYEETHETFGGNGVTLNAYPVERIVSAELDGINVDPDYIERRDDIGVIYLPAYGKVAKVVYEGGFDELPDAIVIACGMIALSLMQASENGGQQITQQMLDGYQVTYSARNQTGDALEMLSPVAAIMLKPYINKGFVRGFA